MMRSKEKQSEHVREPSYARTSRPAQSRKQTVVGVAAAFRTRGFKSAVSSANCTWRTWRFALRCPSPVKNKAAELKLAHHGRSRPSSIWAGGRAVRSWSTSRSRGGAQSGATDCTSPAVGPKLSTTVSTRWWCWFCVSSAPVVRFLFLLRFSTHGVLMLIFRVHMFVC